MMDNKIEYIPNNWFNKAVMEKKNPNHDAHDLCLNGYLFKRQRVNKKSINWLCKNFCSVTKVTQTSIKSLVIISLYLMMHRILALKFETCIIRSIRLKESNIKTNHGFFYHLLQKFHKASKLIS
ncbi:hypothetical protein BpHYR1_052413 [Brachionus plicatilis]|uniref:FLYWCH-type domain-containing protein n=1 Tax=Brachionus plicatilis TaxID=10195 RepID=A0A3M7Q4P6_BRAPC|nr:hypothetical protein BpHYR1_052413 [Brachionus plicatilis]